MKKTLVLGASTKPGRASRTAVRMLSERNMEVVPVGFRAGEVNGVDIVLGRPEVEEVHTVTLYLNPKRQEEWYDYILSLAPQRIIFNPGTENASFQQKAQSLGIETLEACTLVMLATGEY